MKNFMTWWLPVISIACSAIALLSLRGCSAEAQKPDPCARYLKDARYLYDDKATWKSDAPKYFTSPVSQEWVDRSYPPYRDYPAIQSTSLLYLACREGDKAR